MTDQSKPTPIDVARASDLTEEAIAASLGERPARTFVAVISCDAEAMRWARGDAPDGAVVAAQYMMGLRDRGGVPWPVDAETGLAFSLITHPKIPPIRSGRLYLAGVSALLDTIPDAGRIDWPDSITTEDGTLLAGMVDRVSSGVAGIEWAITTFYVVHFDGDRAALMGELVRTFDEHWSRPDAELVGYYKERCRTMGRRVRATFLPLGPRARKVDGEAVEITAGGGLIVVVEGDKKVTLQINDIGKLEYFGEDGTIESSDPLASAAALAFWPLAGDVAPPSDAGWTP
ncbi:MAG: hypothetical protein ACREN2_07935 [Candidatus Dormibacteria bacterium]